VIRAYCMVDSLLRGGMGPSTRSNPRALLKADPNFNPVDFCVELR
jgi:hypothetical protein